MLKNILSSQGMLQKKMLRLAWIIMMSGLVCGLPISARAGVIEVYFTNDNTRSTLYTFHDGQNEYVPLDRIVQLFRLSLEVDPVDGRIVLQNDDKNVSFFPDQETVISDRRSYFLTVPPRKFEGVLMVPLQFITEILPLICEGEIALDTSKRVLRVGLLDLSISNLYVTPYGEYTRIIVDLSQKVTYKVTERLPSRIIFDLPLAQVNIAQKTMQIQNQAVEYVKIVDSFGVTQLVIKPGSKFDHYTHQLSEDPPRLVIDMYNTAQESVLETPPPEASPANGIKETTLTEDEGQQLPLPVKKFALQTVVIDPGHGGSDPGVTIVPPTETTPGIYEKDITLAIGKMLATSLLQRFGEIKVVLTREGDSFVGAEERTTLANNNRADVFVSIHVNNAVSSAVSGFEVYVMDYGSLDLPPGAGGLSAQAQTLDYAQAKYVEMSKLLAQRILDSKKGSLKSAPLFTLKGATMPAVHVEIGYSSNFEDQGVLAEEGFQQSLVAAITDGIAAFKKQEEPGD